MMGMRMEKTMNATPPPITTIMIVVMGGGVAFIVFSILMPIMQLTSFVPK